MVVTTINTLNYLPYLACPICRSSLVLYKISELSVTPEGQQHVRTGIFKCLSCGQYFPVIDSVPRLLPYRMFTKYEKEMLHIIQEKENQTVLYHTEPDLSYEECHRKIEKIVRSRLQPVSYSSKTIRDRIENEIQYRIYHTEAKGKFVDTIRPFISSNPKVILDIGGGQGGTITCFRKAFGSNVALVIDLDVTWLDVCKLRDPEIVLIRADATCLPIRDDAIDLIVSTSTLEHIPQWRNVLEEITRTARLAFICWGPNGLFPFDKGHIDSFYIPGAPKIISSIIALSWHWLRGTRRTFKSILTELQGTQYIPRLTVEKLLRPYGQTINVFSRFMQHSVKATYHYWGGKIKKLLKDHPLMLTMVCHCLMLIGLEPMCYLVFKKITSTDLTEYKKF